MPLQYGSLMIMSPFPTVLLCLLGWDGGSCMFSGTSVVQSQIKWVQLVQRTVPSCASASSPPHLLLEFGRTSKSNSWGKISDLLKMLLWVIRTRKRERSPSQMQRRLGVKKTVQSLISEPLHRVHGGSHWLCNKVAIRENATTICAEQR